MGNKTLKAGCQSTDLLDAVVIAVIAAFGDRKVRDVQLGNPPIFAKRT